VPVAPALPPIVGQPPVTITNAPIPIVTEPVPSAPVVQSAPIYIEQSAPIASQPIITEIIATESPFGLETRATAPVIEAPELAILNAPILESTSVPLLQSAPAPVYESVSLPSIETPVTPGARSVPRPIPRPAPRARPFPVAQPDGTQFLSDKARLLESGGSFNDGVFEPSDAGDDLLPAPGRPLSIEAAPLPPIGSVPAPKVVGYGEVL